MQRERRYTKRQVLKAAGGLGVAGLTGLAGCTSGSDSSGEPTSSPTSEADTDSSTPGTTSGTATSSGQEAMDFGGEEITVLVNLGGLATFQREVVVPRVEEKYNLNINTEQTTTGPMVSQIQANPDSPPDVVDINPNGIWTLNRNDYLATFSDYPDVMTNAEQVYDHVKYFDDTGMGWMLQEVMPIINTNAYDSNPSSWVETVENAESIAIPPYTWTQGLMLLMSAAIATGDDFSSSDLDVESGWEWQQEHMEPKTYTVINGQSQAKQLVSQGQVDALVPTWDSWLLDMYRNDAPVAGARGLSPASIDATQTFGVPKNGNVEAGMAYVNEAVSAYAQERHPQYTGCGIVNSEAQYPQEILDLGIDPVQEGDLSNLKRPDYQYMWDNSDQWAETWNTIYTG